MLLWRFEYNKNFRTGIIVSVLTHLIIAGIVFFFISGKEHEDIIYFQLNEYFPENKAIDFDYSKSHYNNREDSGSFGGGAYLKEIAAVKNQSLFALPNTSSLPNKIKFSHTTNMNPIDSINAGIEGLVDGLGSGRGTGSGSGIGDGAGKGIGNDGAYPTLPFVPRQILEVLPEQEEGSKGTVILALKIGKDGKVLSHLLLLNSTNSNSILEKVLTAAYKSKWQSVKIEDTKVEYWIEKSYNFN